MKPISKLLMFAFIFLPAALDAGTPAPLPVFLQSLECAIGVVSQPAVALGIPEPTLLACTADQWCPNGCYISCSGSSSCLVGANSITCDDSQINCPYPSCSPPPDCEEPCAYCACRASGTHPAVCNARHCEDFHPGDPGQ